MSDTDLPVMIDGVSAIADQFDGYLVDLWGCVHNGIEPYPEAVEALLNLAAQGKTISLLSNGPRRGVDLIARLDQMGVPREAYHYVMSSGEAAWHALADRPDEFHAGFGNRVFHMGPPRDESVFTGNGLLKVDTITAADFILNTGPVEYSHTVGTYQKLLDEALDHELPMVSANPDLVVHIGDDLVICAGLIAQRYEEMGGRVAYHGKPYPSVYNRCFEFLSGIEKQRILGIGDGLRTDILGAGQQGISSLFLSAGIHAEDTGGMVPERGLIRDLATRIASIPNYASARLRW